MFKDFLEAFQQLLLLVRDTRENKTAIERLEEKLQLLTNKVEALAFEVERTRDHERHEREKLTLQLENTLLRFERLLLPGS